MRTPDTDTAAIALDEDRPASAVTHRNLRSFGPAGMVAFVGGIS